MKNDNNKNGKFVIVLLAIAAILVLFFPSIYDLVQSFSMPKVEGGKKDEVLEEKKIDESILETIHYPKMRNSIYEMNTYYKLDKFTVNDLSNNDILYNAFLDIYVGNMTPYEGVGSCTSTSLQFSDEYLKLRVKNILGKKLNYTLSSFYVPEDSDTKYVGTWNYDSINRRFTYVGLCTSKATSVKYYDIEQQVKADFDKDDIVVYYYVGFAKVEGNNYIIYKNPDYTEELSRGTLSDTSELDSLFKKINDNKKRIYKYTFKDTLCTYNEYCLYEGKWVNEL